MSSKLHFTRAWSFMFMARLISFAIPLGALVIIAMAGGNPGSVMPGFIPFAIIFLFTIFQSLCIHIRRLADGRRPTILAGLVMLPVILFIATFSITALTQIGGDGVQDFFAQQRAAAEAEASTGDESETADVQTGTAEVTQEERAAARERQGKNQKIMGEAVRYSFLAWLLSAIGVATFSLTYVARIPNGGEGAFSTGSVPHTPAHQRSYEIG